MYLSSYLSIWPFVSLSFCLSICLSRCRLHCTCHQNYRFNVKTCSEHEVFVHLNFDSHQNVVHFFDISTSTSGPRLSVFNTSALLQQFKLQKVLRAWFCTFWFPRSNGAQFFRFSTFKNVPNPWGFHTFEYFWHQNVLRATAACAFSTSQLVPLSILTDVGWQSCSPLLNYCRLRHPCFFEYAVYRPN